MPDPKPQPTPPSPTSVEAREASQRDAAKAAHDTSVEGARSVADAVRRVADAAVAELQKRPIAGPEGNFVFSASASRFRIRGNGLGTNGTVKIGNQQLNVRAWGTTEIEGDMPANVPQSGEVVVHIDDKTTQRAHYTR